MGIWDLNLHGDNDVSCVFVNPTISEMMVDISRLPNASTSWNTHSSLQNHVEPFGDNSRKIHVWCQDDSTFACASSVI